MAPFSTCARALTEKSIMPANKAAAIESVVFFIQKLDLVSEWIVRKYIYGKVTNFTNFFFGNEKV
jgi:hypothetical protein